MGEFVETDSAKIYTEIIGSLMDYCDEALYPGDERRIIGEGLVQVLTAVFSLFDDRSKQRVLRHARGEVLDAIGEMLRVNRLPASPASAEFVFCVSAPQAQNIVIPQGTRITADGNIYFATVEAVVLQAGSESISVRAECTEGGSAHNGYTAQSIATLVDLIPYISSVYNATATAGGDDGEPYTEEGDNGYRERIRLSPASLSPGTETGYIYHAKSADPDIADIKIDCPEDEPNTVNIYALMQGGVFPDDETLRKILTAIEGADIRIMTDRVQAFPAVPVNYSINIRYGCSAADKAAVVQAVEGEGGAIDQYIAWQSAKMGRAISPDRLRQYLYAAGATTVEISSPAAIIPLGKSQVSRLSGSPAIDFAEVEIE